MRCSLLLVALTACSSGTTAPPANPERTLASTSAEPPISNAAVPCRSAALGLENATRGIRSPESTVVDAMRAKCEADSWPAAAVECFAKMTEGDLGRCAKELPEQMRNAMFSVFGGGPPDRAAIVIARARLSILAVGVAECDQFVTAVSAALGCEAMPIETRVQLGNETADFWDLPTQGLPTEAHQRMAAACGESLAALQAEVKNVGCTM